MSFGDRFGIAGLIVTIAAVGIAILWPDKKYIGWGALALALVLCLVWVYLDRAAILGWHQTYPIGTTAVVALVGALLSAVAFTWFIRSSQLDSEQAAAKAATTPLPAVQVDSERADVHIVSASLELRYDSKKVITEVLINLVVRNLGKRVALKPNVRLWQGYNAKPPLTGEPLVAFGLLLLEPGPHDPVHNNVFYWLAGGYGKERQIEQGENIFESIDSQTLKPRNLPPLKNEPLYLTGLVTFEDSLTQIHHTQEVCFYSKFGWPIDVVSSIQRSARPLTLCD